MHVSGICIYPIKGTHRLELEDAWVEPCGLRFDRRWMIVNDEGVFLSQRTHPGLALIRARPSPGVLTVDAPRMEPLEVPVPNSNPEPQDVRIWKDTVRAKTSGKEASDWFTRFLNVPCRLVFMHDPFSRPVDPAFASGSDFVSFADAFPLLLASDASMADLNARMEKQLSIHRFRPNLTISGSEPFEEDRWKEVRIGAVRMRLVKPCSRCSVTTIDQETGEQDVEPLRTLAMFRKRDGKVFFGQNLIPEQTGRIHIGDDVEVVG